MTDPIVAKLDKIIRLLSLNLKLNSEVNMDIQTILTQVADLNAKIDENTATDAQAIGLLQGLNAKIADLLAQLGNGVQVTAADLQALSDGLTAASAKLAASTAAEAQAVTDNTPAP